MIDSHQHFWTPERGDYGWLQPDSPLYRAFQPLDLAPILKANGVYGTILVQAAPTGEETDYLLGLANTYSWILGVVGWIDLESRDCQEQVWRRAADPLFLGVRPMLQDLPDRAWILRPELRSGIAAVQRAGLTFDALVQSDQLDSIVTLADRYPSLRIILDHAGKPPFLDSQAMIGWLTQLTLVAERPNVVCKLSGLFSQLNGQSAFGRVEACVEFLLERFGPDRVLWGSDWPVASTSISYGDWLGYCRARIDALSATHAPAIFGDNARRVYQLKRHAASLGVSA
jgi:L-fuconolactonase